MSQVAKKKKKKKREREKELQATPCDKCGV